MTVTVIPPARSLWRSRRDDDGDGGIASIEVALVNIMPDAAFETTERQFVRFLHAGSGTRNVNLRRYTMPGVSRSTFTRRLISGGYEPLHALYARPPDALIVTGTEPLCPDLRDEPYWEHLDGLLQWAEVSVRSALLSCLAAHAALLGLDGMTRTRLRSKYSGVYPQTVNSAHPLMRNVGTVGFPHSRLHDVPAHVIEKHGYTVLLSSAKVGWTVAQRDRGCLFVLSQGHPEYSSATLLREYRRDVRRYLGRQSTTYPRIPVGYLALEAVELLQEFKREATAGAPTLALMERFPFEAVSAGIATDWHRPMERLAGNWLDEVQHRKQLRVSARAS